jgi:hypothetical protein
MRGRSHGRAGFLLRGAIVLAVLMLRPLTASAAPVLLGDSVEAGSRIRRSDSEFHRQLINLGFGTVRMSETYTFDITVSEPSPTPVPEPGTLALLGTGFITFIANRNRRRRA